MLLIYIAFFIFLVVIGIIFSLGKGSNMILNSYSAKERAKIDQVALTKFMGKIMFVCAGCVASVSLSETTPLTWMKWVGIVLFVIVLFYAVAESTSPRFQISKRKGK